MGADLQGGPQAVAGAVPALPQPTHSQVDGRHLGEYLPEPPLGGASIEFLHPDQALAAMLFVYRQ